MFCWGGRCLSNLRGVAAWSACLLFPQCRLLRVDKRLLLLLLQATSLPRERVGEFRSEAQKYLTAQRGVTQHMSGVAGATAYQQQAAAVGGNGSSAAYPYGSSIDMEGAVEMVSGAAELPVGQLPRIDAGQANAAWLVAATASLSSTASTASTACPAGPLLPHTLCPVCPLLTRALCACSLPLPCARCLPCSWGAPLRR
jgi:hypothetical protein